MRRPFRLKFTLCSSNKLPLFYPAHLYNLDRRSINRWSKTTLTADVLSNIQLASPTASIWRTWRLENCSIIEKQGHVVGYNRLTISKTNGPLDVRCVLSCGSYNGVSYLSVFRINKKNRKSGGLQTRKLTSNLTACLSIFNSKIHRLTTYRIRAPSTGTGRCHPNAKIQQILQGIRNWWIVAEDVEHPVM
jgi:hypothetical protein